MKLLRPALLTLTCLLVQPTLANDLPSLGDASSGIVSPEQEHVLGRAWLSLLLDSANGFLQLFLTLVMLRYFILIETPSNAPAQP